MFDEHVRTHVALSHEQVMLIVEAGLCDEEDFQNTAGDLWVWLGLEE
jgi:hypothetical protein